MSGEQQQIAFNKLCDFNNEVYRNIQAVTLTTDEFDDLTSDLRAKSYAHKAANAFNQTNSINNLQYHAIDFIFAKKSWPLSRFCNGQFPVWYSSTNLITSFYETIYSYKRTFFEMPGFDANELKILKTARTVFKVKCQGALIDLRADAEKFPALISRDPQALVETQTIGLRVYKESYPGIIAKSARAHVGENVIIFKKNLLSKPSHDKDYIYEYDFLQNKVRVRPKGSEKIIFEDAYSAFY